MFSSLSIRKILYLLSISASNLTRRFLFSGVRSGWAISVNTSQLSSAAAAMSWCWHVSTSKQHGTSPSSKFRFLISISLGLKFWNPVLNFPRNCRGLFRKRAKWRDVSFCLIFWRCRIFNIFPIFPPFEKLRIFRIFDFYFSRGPISLKVIYKLQRIFDFSGLSNVCVSIGSHFAYIPSQRE